MITKKDLINTLNEFGDAICSLQEGMKVSLRSCNDFRCFRDNYRRNNEDINNCFATQESDIKDIRWELELIKKTITSILLELDEKDEQIKELYELVSKNDGKRE